MGRGRIGGGPPPRKSDKLWGCFLAGRGLFVSVWGFRPVFWQKFACRMTEPILCDGDRSSHDRAGEDRKGDDDRGNYDRAGGRHSLDLKSS